MKQVSIDHHARLVELVYAGDMTDFDLRDQREQYAGLDGKYSFFIDLSGVTAFHVSSSAVRESASRLAKASDRCALFAPSTVAFGMARMYQILSGSSGVAVFSDPASARAWVQRTG